LGVASQWHTGLSLPLYRKYGYCFSRYILVQ
jgi:hypothetical protein